MICLLLSEGGRDLVRAVVMMLLVKSSEETDAHVAHSFISCLLAQLIVLNITANKGIAPPAVTAY